MPPTEAIFFDLYETLITEFDPDWHPLPTLAERLGIDAQGFDSAWQALREARMTDANLDYLDVLRDICAAHDREVEEDTLLQLREERVASKAAPFARIDADVMRMLRDIQATGMKIGVISNCATEEVAAWETSPLAEIVDAAVFSCQAGCAKPDVEIYRLACERLDVAPEQSIFVGDGGSNELTGAGSAGLIPFQAVWFLDLWPAWKRTASLYDAASDFPKLDTPSTLSAKVAAQSRT